MHLIDKNNPQNFSQHEIKATRAMYTTNPAFGEPDYCRNGKILRNETGVLGYIYDIKL